MTHYLQYDREQLDHQYNTRTGVPRVQDIFDRWQMQAEDHRRGHEMRSNLHYGTHKLQTLDYFPAGEGDAPLLIFVHGGYWRSLDKDDFSHVAASYRQAGIAVAMFNYRLAPEVDISDIVTDVRTAFVHLYRQAGALGFDAGRIHVAGHSAGGHLAATLAGTDWRGVNLPSDAIKSICGVSGLYDLEPVRLCYLNDMLQLDAAQVAQYSPVHHLPPVDVPVLLTVGGAESAEFHRQQAAYAQRLQAAGNPVRQVAFSDGNHFDVIDRLADGNGELARALIAMIGA